jgi:hypothetical protein
MWSTLSLARPLGWPLIAVLSLSLTQASQAPRPMSFSATLTSIKVSARPGQVITRQFQLTLDGDQARSRFKAKVEDWWRSEDGQQSFYGAPGTLRRSCARWTSLNPVESNVEPGGTLVVRITVTVPRELVPGGYWCALTVDEVPDPLASSAGVGVRFAASVSTGIFLYVDPVERDASILDLKIDSTRIAVKVRNQGNAPLGIEGRLQFFVPGSSIPAATIDLPRTTVLTEPFVDGELSGLLPSATALPSGRYVVRAILDIGADHDIGAEREITLTRASSSNAPVR